MQEGCESDEPLVLVDSQLTSGSAEDFHSLASRIAELFDAAKPPSVSRAPLPPPELMAELAAAAAAVPDAADDSDVID